MKCEIKIFLIFSLFPFFLFSQIWKYPPSPFQYHHSIDLNHDLVNRRGIKTMSINVFIENDTLNAYTKYDSKGRIIEYRSEYDKDTIFYFYKKGQLWSATKFGRSGKKVKRIIKFRKGSIISIQTNFSSGIDISRFYYDDNQNIIKAIHNDTIIEDFSFYDMKLITYSKTISGVIQNKITFSYGLDTVFYSDYIFPKNQEKLVEEIYGIFKNGHLTEITTKRSYGVNNVSISKYYFQSDSDGKLLKSWEEYLSDDNKYEQGRYTETFSYDKSGKLIKRELISKTEKPRTLCEYFYVYY